MDFFLLQILYSTVNVFSFPYGFRSNVFFPLAYFIVEYSIQYV